jgi:hypothetical protein
LDLGLGVFDGASTPLSSLCISHAFDEVSAKDRWGGI